MTSAQGMVGTRLIKAASAQNFTQDVTASTKVKVTV